MVSPKKNHFQASESRILDIVGSELFILISIQILNKKMNIWNVEHYEKIRQNSKFWLVFVEGGMVIRIKKTEYCIVKTLRRDRLGDFIKNFENVDFFFKLKIGSSYAMKK